MQHMYVRAYVCTSDSLYQPFVVGHRLAYYYNIGPEQCLGDNPLLFPSSSLINFLLALTSTQQVCHAATAWPTGQVEGNRRSRNTVTEVHTCAPTDIMTKCILLAVQELRFLLLNRSQMPAYACYASKATCILGPLSAVCFCFLLVGLFRHSHCQTDQLCLFSENVLESQCVIYNYSRSTAPTLLRIAQ